MSSSFETLDYHLIVQLVKNNHLLKIPHDNNVTRVRTLSTTAIRDETFLQFDSGPDKRRTLILVSLGQSEILAGTTDISIDGTCKVCVLFQISCLEKHDNPT
jgi:hypothetical protein